jgi:hypothetical protein
LGRNSWRPAKEHSSWLQKQLCEAILLPLKAVKKVRN